MGQSISAPIATQTCPKCTVQLFQSDMAQHVNGCTKVTIIQKTDGSWEYTYLGPNPQVLPNALVPSPPRVKVPGTDAQNQPPAIAGELGKAQPLPNQNSSSRR